MPFFKKLIHLTQRLGRFIFVQLPIEEKKAQTILLNSILEGESIYSSKDFRSNGGFKVFKHKLKMLLQNYQIRPQSLYV